MDKYKILKFPDKRLKTIASPVEKFDSKLKQLVDDMFTIMYANNGAGLAATQIDVHKQIFVMDLQDPNLKLGDKQVFINLKILETTDSTMTTAEGCLSVPYVRAKITRSDNIKISYQDLHGTQHVEEVTGFAAVCIQHENDHLNGILFIDRLSKLKRALIVKKINRLKKQDLEDN